MAQDEWVTIDEWEDIPSTPIVKAPTFWDRTSELGEGLYGMGKSIYESGFGNPMSMFGNMIRQGPEEGTRAARDLMQGMVIDPIKGIWGGLRSEDPNALTRELMRASGFNPENIKEDYNASNYGALAGDILPQAGIAALTAGAGRYLNRAKPSGALFPDEILPPEVGPQKQLIGKVEAPLQESWGQRALPRPKPEGMLDIGDSAPTYEGPRQIEGMAPRRLELPAVGETVDNRTPSFIAGERGLVDTSLDYPIDLADQTKLRGNPITPEDIVEIARVRPDLDTPQIMAMLNEKGTLLESEMGSLGSLNPIDVAAGRTGNNIAQGLPADLAQVDPVFGALVPDRLKAPNESLMPSENPLGMRGPRVEAPILEQPLGGRIVNPPTPEAVPTNIGAFSSGTLVGEEAANLRPKPVNPPNIPPFVASTLDDAQGAASLRPKVKEFPKVYGPNAKLDPTRTDFDTPEIQHQLRDVGKDMNPAVRGAGASNIPEVKAAAAQVLASRPGFIRNTYDYLGTSGWSILDNMGPAGKELSRFMRKTRAEGSSAAGSIISKYRAPIDKLTDKEFSIAVDHVESGKASPSAKIQSAVDAIKGLLDEAGQFAENSGMVMANPSGQLTKFQRMRNNYFPHKWAPGTFNEGSLINELVSKGMSVQQARFVVENGIKSGPRLISPQHMRSMNLQGYLKTKGALMEHVDDLMTRSKEAQNYGPTDLGNPDSPIMQLIKQTADPEKALQIARDQLGRVKRDPDLERVAAAVNTFEATVKLPLFAISNMNQAAAIGMRASTKNFVKGFYDTVKNGVKSAEDTGALQTTAINILKETGQNKITKGASKVFGWQKSEEFLRSWSANAGKAQADSLFNRLKKNPADMTARAQLDDLLLEDVDTVLGQKSLTPQQTKIAGFRMSELTQGLVDAADLPPMWSANPLLRIPLMFKRFAFQQNKIMKDAFASAKSPQEKAMMATKLLGLYTVTGEVTKDVKSVIANLAGGKDPFEGIMERGETPMGRIIGNISNAYALGLAGEIIEQTATGSPARVLSFLAGPAISDVINLGTAAGRSLEQGDIAPFGREAIRMAPLGYAVAPQVFPPQ